MKSLRLIPVYLISVLATGLITAETKPLCEATQSIQRRPPIAVLNRDRETGLFGVDKSQALSIVIALRGILGRRLKGVYAIGSRACGKNTVTGRGAVQASDLDLVLVYEGAGTLPSHIEVALGRLNLPFTVQIHSTTPNETEAYGYARQSVITWQGGEQSSNYHIVPVGPGVPNPLDAVILYHSDPLGRVIMPCLRDGLIAN